MRHTDEELIKSLQICSSNGECNECPINPHKGNYGFCTSLAIKAALDLIIRQKEEIERLTLSEREAYKQLERGNERMMAIIAEEREDAIKEVAKELKKRKYQSSDWSHGEHPYVVEESDIDDVLEDMIGGSDDEKI